MRYFRGGFLSNLTSCGAPTSSGLQLALLDSVQPACMLVVVLAAAAALGCSLSTLYDSLSLSLARAWDSSEFVFG